MLKSLSPVVVAFALTACGQSAETTAPAEEAQTDTGGFAQSTGGDCRVLTSAAPAAGLETLSAAGVTISATPGVLSCAAPGAESASECAFTGPGEAYVNGPSAAGFAFDAGQTGTLVVGPNGPQCYLNANGG